MIEGEHVVWTENRFEYVLTALKDYLEIKEKETGKKYCFLRIIIKGMELELNER